MSVEVLSRIQFATVALFHFLFVPLTLGLTVMVACMESRYARTGDETFLKMTRYWSRLLLVNFAVGVVTGHHPGVPVRHELGRVLQVRRGHLRRPACHRGDGGLLPGVDIHRAVDVQLEAGVARRRTPPSCGWWPWQAPCRRCGSCLPTGGCRGRAGTRSSAGKAELCPSARCWQPLRLDQVLPRDLFRLHPDRVLHHGHLRHPCCEEAQRGDVPEVLPGRRHLRHRHLGHDHLRGGPFRRAGGEVPASKLAAMESQWETEKAPRSTSCRSRGRRREDNIVQAIGHSPWAELPRLPRRERGREGAEGFPPGGPAAGAGGVHAPSA